MLRLKNNKIEAFTMIIKNDISYYEYKRLDMVYLRVYYTCVYSAIKYI